MKFFSLVVGTLLMCLWNSAMASQYDWVIPKIPKNLTENDEGRFIVGTIDKQKYLAAHINVGNETLDESKPVLVFARIAADNTFKPFALIELDTLLETTVQIKNESIYLRHATANNGVYSSTYQFKPKNNQFQLVGIEKQSITLGNSSKTGKTIQLWEGVSANLVSSIASYWASALSMENPKEEEQVMMELDRYNQGLVPSKRTWKEVLLKLKHPENLEHFNLYNSDAEHALCHSFDYDLQFHNDCK